MKNQKGITLIALVITIIVLLILAGVSIAMLSGDNGILTRATTTKEANAEATAREEASLAYMAVRTEIAAQKVKNGVFDPKDDTTASQVTVNNVTKTAHKYLADVCDDELDSNWEVTDNTASITLKYTNSSLNNTNHTLTYTINLAVDPVTISEPTEGYKQIQ